MQWSHRHAFEAQEAQVKAALDKHLLQVKNLEKIRQCLLSSVKDYESEKKELEKAWHLAGGQMFF